MRMTCTLIMASFLALCSFLCAQDNREPNPGLPSEILGPPLVAWSALQQPRPIPATFASADNSAADIPAVQIQIGQSDSEPTLSSVQTFTGTIAKDGGRYLLKISDSAAYQVDNEEKLNSCEGRQVKIAGKLDAKNRVLHIANVEILS
jgi:hypothetical protein